MSNDQFIVIKGASEHNLKQISTSIPRDTLTVITGLSGSGKSSLAFDTIFAEGQRRYIESLSTYARQFLPVLEKPKVESIEGLSPTISIQQKTTSHNPRSTVGTVTEIYDYLRLLYARVSVPFCYECGKPITSQTSQQIVDQIYDRAEGSKISILAPIARGKKGEFQKEIQAFIRKGFTKGRVDGEVVELADVPRLEKHKKHNIDIYIDRLVIRKSKPSDSSPDPLRFRILESVELALKLAEGLVLVETAAGATASRTQEELFSEKFACADCGLSLPAPEPRTFSFNSPMGACPSCDGLGCFYLEDDDDSESEGDDETTAAIQVIRACDVCHGTRLKKEGLCYKIQSYDISQLCGLSISALAQVVQGFRFTERELKIIDRVLKEIKDRLEFLNSVGLSYLSLSRSAQTLSGGEGQRIRLATQIGSALTGVVYVLDEPSIGLHQRDNDRLIENLLRLRDKGNTVLVVEHDKDTMEKADHIIDMGPGAGTHGGEIVVQGRLPDILKSSTSLTGRYLNGTLSIPVPKSRREGTGHQLKLLKAHGNNLKNVDLSIPLGQLVCVTGVSGSGKSSLIIDTLYAALMNKLNKTPVGDLKFETMTGHEHIDKVIDIDQSPIGRTPRSNPATYTGTFSVIRNLFAQVPLAKTRGFRPGRFSFNVKGGRCEECQGGGLARVEMHFLSDIYVTCGTCNGLRYNDDTLAIKYKGKSIADVLNLTIDEGQQFFENVPALSSKLAVLSEVGLGYITLGQSATTLSGGEAQRLKLATELSRRATGKTLYILDEPSTGLHFDDVRKLILVLHKLVDQGNTVVVIEHNLEIIKVADTIIDMGPEGGEAGGTIVFTGRPEKLIGNPQSITGAYLKPYLK